MFGPWVIHNNGMVPSMLTFRRIPSRFTTTKVYSISVFLFSWRPKLLVKPNFGSFWKFLHGQKSGFTSTFFCVFHFHAHLFFTGTFFNFFHGLEIFYFEGQKFEFDNKAIIWGYKIVLIWKTGKFCFSPIIFKSFFDFFHGDFFFMATFSQFFPG